MYTLFLHYYFLIGLSVNSILYSYLALQNHQNKVLAFISFHYAVLFLPLLHFSLHLCSSPLLLYTALLRTSEPYHSEKQCLEKLYGRVEH